MERGKDVPNERSDRKNKFKRNSLEKKRETIYLKCIKDGTYMNCKPAKKRETLSDKGRESTPNPITFAEKKRKILQKNRQYKLKKMAELETTLKEHHEEVAELLLEAIHEARKTIPTLSEMIEVINEMIDEEFHRHTRLILAEEKKAISHKKRKFSLKQNQIHHQIRGKLLMQFNNSGTTKGNQNLLSTRNSSSNLVYGKIEPSLSSLTVSSRLVTFGINETSRKEIRKLNEKIATSSKAAFSKNVNIRQTNRTSLEEMRKQLANKKLEYLTHIQKHGKKHSKKIDPVKFENSNTEAAIKPKLNRSENNIDLSYVLQRLASKREGFLNRVQCSHIVTSNNEPLFNEIADIPWVGLSKLTPYQKDRKNKRKILRVKNTMSSSNKTPQLQLLPVKLNTVLDSQGTQV